MIKNILISFKSKLEVSQSIYIAFDPIFSDVPPSLYSPGEAIITIQSDTVFEVNDIGISVIQSINNIKYKAFVPFTSITNYVDALHNFSINLQPVYSDYNGQINHNFSKINDASQVSNILKFPNLN